MAKCILIVAVVILAVTVGLQQWTIREYKDVCRRWQEVAATYQEAWIEDVLDGQWPHGLTPIRDLKP